jgi:hypothetical protein
VKFMLLIYNDPTLLDALPKNEFDSRMRYCLAHADELRDQGKLLDAQMLGAPAAAKSVRIRAGRQTTTDGPFAETKEMIAGFNVVEAASRTRPCEWRPSFRGRKPVASRCGRSSTSKTCEWRSARRAAHHPAGNSQPGLLESSNTSASNPPAIDTFFQPVTNCGKTIVPSFSMNLT